MLAKRLWRLIGTTARNVRGTCALIVCLAAAESAVAQSGIPCRYEIVQIIQHPFPCSPPGLTVGKAISPNGRWVVGYFRQCVFSDDRGFVYDVQTGQFTALDMGQANDVSDMGLVVGHTADGRGYIYNTATTHTTYLYPAVPPSMGTCAVNAINSSGVVCGTRTIQATNGIRNAFIRWPDGTFEDLGVVNGPRSGAMDIDDSNTILGWTGGDIGTSNSRAFVYANGIFTVIPPVPGSANSIPAAMNNSGVVLVYGTPGATTFRWDRGVMVAVPPLPGHVRANALMLNDADIAVGASHASSNVTVPALWVENSPIDLGTRIEPVASVYLEYAFAISESGTIGLNGYYNSDSAAFVVRPLKRVTGDATCDGVVNVNDLLAVINTWGPCQTCSGDLNDDGLVNSADLLIVIQNWTLEARPTP